MKFKNYLISSLLVLISSTTIRAGQFSVLLFSKTAGWHHDSISAGVAAIEALGKLHDFNVFWTEDAHRVFNDKELAKYKVVVFLNTTGDILDDGQKAAFEKFIRAGGGFVGIHSAADTEYHWVWYTRMVGRMFHIHPPVQTAVVQVEDRNFPGMERFPKRFLATDEWYEFQAPLSDKLHYLLSVDEKSYDPKVVWVDQKREGKGMGAFHPISWYQEYEGGRAFYTAMGHLPAVYGDAAFLHHIFGGIYWAATGNLFKAE